MADIHEERPLTPEEYQLTRWLLQHGTPESARYLADLASARVASRCACGCASVNFAVAGREPLAGAGLQVLADYQWRDAAGHLGGVFAFSRAGVLAGLEVWSIDGQAATDQLPAPEVLEPIGGAPAT